MKSLSRSTALKIAAAISFLISAIAVVGTLPLLTQGAASVDQRGDSPPFVVVLISFSVGVVGIVAAYPTWKGQRLGIILTILANLVNGLSAVPGILFAPNPTLTIVASVTVLLSVLIIALCLWPDRKPVVA